MNEMLYIIWQESNNLGIPIIDEQHRGIVSTINSFHYAIRRGLGLDVLKPTLNILALYTVIHFKSEEELLREAGYPELEAHIRLHEELIRKTREIATESTTFKEPEIALKFLKDWWLGHINRQDRKYASFLRQGQ